MKQAELELFRTLTELPGVSGYEDEVRDFVRSELEKDTDEIITDNLGGIFGVLRGDENGPKVMVSGHMDEVGFMVARITDKGMLKFQPLGGWWSQVVLAQQLAVITKTGKRIPGVVGSIPQHLLDEATRSKPMALDNMFVDVGADSREEVREMGIMPGNMIVPICPFTPLGNGKRIMAKAWDNRLGTGLAIQLLHELKAEGAKLPNILYTGATVQEEVGLRGAKTAVDLIQPDLAYALDVGPANDATGDKFAFGQLGGGTLLRVMDRSIVTNRRLVEFVLQTAEDNNIPYQFFISPGGTDAGELQFYGRGVPVAPLGVVARYIHSAASIMHTADYDAAKELLIKLVKLSDRQLVQDLLPY